MASPEPLGEPPRLGSPEVGELLKAEGSRGGACKAGGEVGSWREAPERSCQDFAAHGS